MTGYPTDIHGPAASAPSVTNKYAVCQVCGVQWQVRSPNGDDTRGCSFCGADKRAVRVMDETPDYQGGE